MKVCYLIQSHKNLRQVLKLVSILRKSSPSSLIVVSHNSSYSSNPLKEVKNNNVIFLEDKRKIARGDFSLVQSYLENIKLLRKYNYDWLVNLSGQCYPVRPLEEFEKMLENLEADGLMDCFPIEFQPLVNGIYEWQDRYFFQYLKLNIILPDPLRPWLNKYIALFHRIQGLFRVNLWFGCYFGVRAIRTPFTADFPCLGGSYFKALSAKAINILIKESEKNIYLKSFYKKTRNPDESYIQTLIGSHKDLYFRSFSHFYISFSEDIGHGHPNVLRSSDLHSILNSQETIYYFARKFDCEIDEDIFIYLDKMVSHEK